MPNLTFEDRLILCSLPFSAEDNPERLSFLARVADDLVQNFEGNDENIASDARLAEKYKQRANSLRGIAICSSSSYWSTQNFYNASDMGFYSRFVLGSIDRVKSIENTSFLPPEFGFAGIINASFDLAFDASVCLKSVFCPTPQEVNLRPNKRFFNRLEKGNRPYRMVGSTVGLTCGLVSLVPGAGVFAMIAGWGCNLGLSIMAYQKDMYRYDSLLEKLESPELRDKIQIKRKQARKAHLTTIGLNTFFVGSIGVFICLAPQAAAIVLLGLALVMAARKVYGMLNNKAESVEKTRSKYSVGLFGSRSSPSNDDNQFKQDKLFARS